MPSKSEQVRELVRLAGLTLPEERLEKLTALFEATLEQAEAIRPQSTPHPKPSGYDAAWETRK